MKPSTLAQLGGEYLEEASRVYARIHAIKEGMTNLSDEEEKRLRVRLSQLYGIARDCELTGKRLLHYYD